LQPTRVSASELNLALKEVTVMNTRLWRRIRLTPLGIVLMIFTTAGIVALLVGSHGVQTAGFAAIVLVLTLLVTAEMSVRLRRPDRAAMGRTHAGQRIHDPEPQYIEKAAEPSEEVWARELQHYRDRDSPVSAGESAPWQPRRWRASIRALRRPPIQKHNPATDTATRDR
jgi:hypothetical protein